jgi:PPM family protein phosphatase
VQDVELAWGAATDTGQRAENQDSSVARPPVFAVADGMGGHAEGRQASEVVVDRLAATEGTALTVEGLREAIRDADARIRSVAESIADARGMGTTVAGVALVEAVVDGTPQPCWAVFHVGDSRVYLLSGGRLERISTDHSVVQELLDAGMIRAGDVASHPQRHLVTRALGVGSPGDPDVALVPVEPGQRFLACSDGLTGEMDDEEIARLLAGAADPGEAAAVLVRTAADRGASDNVTAVVVEVRPLPES